MTLNSLNLSISKINAKLTAMTTRLNSIEKKIVTKKNHLHFLTKENSDDAKKEYEKKHKQIERQKNQKENCISNQNFYQCICENNENEIQDLKKNLIEKTQKIEELNEKISQMKLIKKHLDCDEKEDLNKYLERHICDTCKMNLKDLLQLPCNHLNMKCSVCYQKNLIATKLLKCEKCSEPIEVCKKINYN